MSVSSDTSLLKPPKQTAKQKDNRGVALAETLIAMAILTIGMIGLLEMQRQGLWAAIDNHRSIVADILLYDATERMRSNAQDTALFDAGNPATTVSTSTTNPTRTIRHSDYYSPPDAFGSPADCLNSDCFPNQIANLDVFLWRDNLQRDLNVPSNNASAVICYNDTTRNRDMALDASGQINMTCTPSDEVYPLQRYLDNSKLIGAGAFDSNRKYKKSGEVARSVPNHTIKFQWTNMAGKLQSRATYLVVPALKLDNYRE